MFRETLLSPYGNFVFQLDDMRLDMEVQTSLGRTITGTEEQDLLRGFVGDDIIFGLGGNDTIIGGGGNDEIYGGEGNDGILGGDGDDLLFGGNGDDVLSGGEGDDFLVGGDGDDYLDGGTGRDRLDAGVGNDRIFDDGGRDILLGGHGNDRFTIFSSDNERDWYSGGRGVDTIEYLSVNSTDFTITLNIRGLVEVTNAEGVIDTLHRFEFISFEDVTIDLSLPLPSLIRLSADDDVFEGSSNSDTILGFEGDDVLSGLGGVDRLEGGAGNDRLFGGDGNDGLDGGIGDDFLSGGDGDDFLDDGLGGGRDVLDGGAGNDTLWDRGGRDILLGGDGDDRLVVFSSSSDGERDWYAGGLGTDRLQYAGSSSSEFTITQNARGLVEVTDANGVVDTLHRIEFIIFTDITIDLEVFFNTTSDLTSLSDFDDFQVETEVNETAVARPVSLDAWSLDIFDEDIESFDFDMESVFS